MSAHNNINLSTIGKIIDNQWNDIPHQYKDVALGRYIIVPNHIHGIIHINNNRTQNIVSLHNEFCKIISGSLGAIIRGYKIGVTKWFRNNTDIPIVWQKSFHDHIIRIDETLNKIREYIINNPHNWEMDENNIKNYKVTVQACLNPTGQI